MTSSEATPTGSEPDVGLRVELSRVEAELSELLREAHEVRAQLTDEGAMDSADRSSIITQAEQLEAIAAELEQRREGLLARLKES
ncbi:MAG: hypothetical protein JWQ93_1408 [Marmoricola sp.]|jgi:hypothetical protein|nr:hypothetical protein [Marmoricola sp.]MCW2837547.1 hypothetical protein [Marmoricola sp.]